MMVLAELGAGHKLSFALLEPTTARNVLPGRSSFGCLSKDGLFLEHFVKRANFVQVKTLRALARHQSLMMMLVVVAAAMCKPF